MFRRVWYLGEGGCSDCSLWNGLVYCPAWQKGCGRPPDTMVPATPGTHLAGSSLHPPTADRPVGLGRPDCRHTRPFYPMPLPAGSVSVRGKKPEGPAGCWLAEQGPPPRTRFNPSPPFPARTWMCLLRHCRCGWLAGGPRRQPTRRGRRGADVDNPAQGPCPVHPPALGTGRQGSRAVVQHPPGGRPGRAPRRRSRRRRGPPRPIPKPLHGPAEDAACKQREWTKHVSASRTASPRVYEHEERRGEGTVQAQGPCRGCPHISTAGMRPCLCWARVKDHKSCQVAGSCWWWCQEAPG